jgi:putative toxin-antitoxin system antitoxin component (TIGR02293 family)
MDCQQRTIDTVHEDVVAAAVRLFEGDRKAAIDWLNQPLLALGHQVPASYMDSPERIQEVLEIIGRLEHGVWT